MAVLFSALIAQQHEVSEDMFPILFILGSTWLLAAATIAPIATTTADVPKRAVGGKRGVAKHKSVAIKRELLPTESQSNKLIKRSEPPAPATEELIACEAACRAAVQSILRSLGEGDKYTDTEWNPLDNQGNVLYAADGPVRPDCTVGEPDGWERLSERCSAPVLIEDGISVADVAQGQIGDCFLITAMGSVAAARPDALKSLFVAYDISKGVYGVRLFLNGSWQYVIVDDYVAVWNSSIYPDGTPAGTSLLFASSSDANECWLPILEKAVAKSVKCYENSRQQESNSLPTLPLSPHERPLPLLPLTGH